MNSYKIDQVTYQASGRLRRPRNPVAGLDVPRGVRVRGVDEDVGVDDEHPLTAFHRLIQGVPIRDLDEGASAMEDRERRELRRFLLRLEEIAQRGLDQVGHCSPLPRRLAPEFGHDRFVDIERRLHMENHMMDMVVCPGALYNPFCASSRVGRVR